MLSKIIPNDTNYFRIMFKKIDVCCVVLFSLKNNKKLEMCQDDTDAPAQGHPHPHAGILQKIKLK